MGLVVFFVQESAKVFLLAAILYFLYRIFSNSNRKNEALLGAAYVMGFEVFSRMTGGAFTYEFVKYAVIAFLGLGMFYTGFKLKSWPYVIFILCLIPGIFVASVTLSYGAKVGNAIGFNLRGPASLAISALYCYENRITTKRYQEILLAAMFPIISMTTYLYVFTPDLRDAINGTSSNFAASGGFGPNQVATVLGLAMFILYSRLLVVKSNLLNIIDLVLLAAVSYRAIATFSRGGVITAVVCALLFTYFYFKRAPKVEKSRLIPRIFTIIGVMTAVWLIVSISTSGLIDKRYTNQNAAGVLKDDITTGRSELITTELEAFVENPIIGIGVGKVKEYRYLNTGELSATHNEISRMLSEHGILGIVGLLILMFTPIFLWLKNKSNYYLIPFLFFWFATINHTSMRIAAPGFIYGLCLITLLHEKKNTLRR